MENHQSELMFGGSLPSYSNRDRAQIQSLVADFPFYSNFLPPLLLLGSSSGISEEANVILKKNKLSLAKDWTHHRSEK